MSAAFLRSRRALGLGAALAAAAAAVAWAAGGGPATGAGGGEGWTVRRGDLPLTVEVSGTLRSTDSQQLGPPQVPGTWNYEVSWMAPEGSEVGPGEPVVRFDATELERQLLAKLAERDSAETELEKRRVELERSGQEAGLKLAEAEARLRRARLATDVPPELTSAKELAEARIDRGIAEREVASLTARRELEQAAGRAELAALREKRDRAAARVGEIEEQIRRMTLTAPRAGTVIYVADRGGDKPKVGDSVWQMQKVVEIPDLRRMEAEGQVDEADVGRIAVGQEVTLRLDAHPDQRYGGTVRRIANAVERRWRGNPVKEVDVVVALAATDAERMRPGMRFQGEIVVERVRDALLVPPAAVASTPDGPVVRRRTLLGDELVSVELGRAGGDEVEVLAGLAAGDRLLPVGREELAR